MPLKFVTGNDDVYQLLRGPRLPTGAQLGLWAPLGNFRPLGFLAYAVLKFHLKTPGRCANLQSKTSKTAVSVRVALL